MPNQLSKSTAFRMILCIYASLLTSTAVVTSQAQFVMYDFEQPWQFEDWTTLDDSTQRVESASRFTASGGTTAHLQVEPNERPAELRLRLWDNNFEPYDRLAFTLTNASRQSLRLTAALVGDYENGFRFPVEIPAMSRRAVVQELKLPAFIRHDNLHFLVFHAEPGQLVDAYLDDLVALREGEAAPELEPTNSLLQDPRQHALRDTIGRHRAAVEDIGLPAPKQMLLDKLEAVESEVDGKPLNDERTAKHLDTLQKIGWSVERFRQLAGQVEEGSGESERGFLIGFADAMHKVMPQHLPVDLEIRDSVELSLAGGEKEAVQIVVAPFDGDVEAATVRVSELQGPDGRRIGAEHVAADLVGFIETTFKTTPDVDYVGWWPDPLIDTDDPIDVKLGDVQPWWIRVAAPRDQTPGMYQGVITVSAQGQPDQEFPLKVRVRDFNVPRHAPIPTAVTFVGHTFKNYPVFQDGGWDKRKFEYTDMLNDYLINMDSLYRWADPDRLDAVDWELIDYQQEKGTLVCFNFGYFYDAKPEKIEAFRPYYREAKKRGLLDKAYIYGWDETGPDTWPEIETATRKLDEAFPEVLTMVTSQDHSYGFNSPLKHLGAWVPILSRYNPHLAEKARDEGRSIWWYTCIWPPHPYPNIFLDYPAIENRVLTGLMHMKYQPDGFLYYATTMWPKPEEMRFIRSYPYTEWIAESFAGSNADGSYFCLMQDGTLVPTLRVENYRDGFEDLAYWMILEHQVDTYREQSMSSDDAWLDQASDALEAVNELVPDRRSWPTSAETIRGYREKLADLIEAAPVEDTDPWKDGMGVRGLPRD